MANCTKDCTSGKFLVTLVGLGLVAAILVANILG